MTLLVYLVFLCVIWTRGIQSPKRLFTTLIPPRSDTGKDLILTEVVDKNNSCKNFENVKWRVSVSWRFRGFLTVECKLFLFNLLYFTYDSRRIVLLELYLNSHCKGFSLVLDLFNRSSEQFSAEKGTFRITSMG